MGGYLSSSVNLGPNENVNVNVVEYNPEYIPEKKFGWVRGLPDHRDKVFTFYKNVETPKEVSLKDNMPIVYDQGSLGSCTANAIGAAFQFDQLKQKLPDFIPSRLFIYYNERVLLGTVNYDSGAIIRDGMKTLNKEGTCDEKDWQYDITKFTLKPPKECYEKAIPHRAVHYYKINPDFDQFKKAIASGYPVVFGFSVPKSFMDIDSSGIMSMPSRFERVVGGHAVLACGYDDNMEANGQKGYMLVRNSWGQKWGQEGYFWMPYSFINDKWCDDCWVLESVSGNLSGVETGIMKCGKVF